MTSQDQQPTPSEWAVKRTEQANNERQRLREMHEAREAAARGQR